MTSDDIDNLNEQDEDLDEEQEDGGQQDKVEWAPGHSRGAARDTAHKWRGAWDENMLN